MEKQTWSRVDGMIIAKELDPDAIAGYLAEQGVVAQLEWYESTPNMMGIRIAADGDHVAVMGEDSAELQPGPTRVDFVESLADRYQAEVMIGDLGIDRLDPADAQDIADIEDEESSDSLRVVEIGDTPASAIPLMAAFEGLDVADIDLKDGKRAILAQLPPDRSGWYFGDVPLVALTFHNGEFQAFFVADDDPENVVTYNWGMQERIIPGGRTGDAAAEALAHEIVGSKEEIGIIHDAVPGIDKDRAFNSTLKRGEEAVEEFVAALGLPHTVAKFLLGRRTLDAIEDAAFHEARGISNALGRSVDIMLDRRETESRFWDYYSTMLAERPWQVPVISLTEAAVGTTLILLGRGRGKPRGFFKSLGTLAGASLLVDSVAELALAKYMTRRAARHHEEQEARQGEMPLS